MQTSSEFDIIDRKSIVEHHLNISQTSWFTKICC